jgi:hypothetical protein
MSYEGFVMELIGKTPLTTHVIMDKINERYGNVDIGFILKGLESGKQIVYDVATKKWSVVKC